MTKLSVEFLQLIILAGYLFLEGRKETPVSNIILTWWCVVLVIDVFLWQGNRPAYVRDWLNIFDVGVGMVLIYAKAKNPCKHIMALVVSLFR